MGVCVCVCGGGGGCSFSGFVFACVNPLAVRYTQETDIPTLGKVSA